MPQTCLLSSTLQRTWATSLSLTAAACVMVFCVGCLKKPPVFTGVTAHVTTPADNSTAPEQFGSTDAAPPEDSPPQDKPAEPVDAPPEDETVEPAVVWKALFEQTCEHVRKGALEEAAKRLAKLDEVELELTTEQATQLAAVRSDLDNRQRGRRLQAAIGRLASKKREDVEAAQNELYEDPDLAMPLLREAAYDENPLLVKNSLEMLRRLRRPDDTLPIMVDMLRKPELRKNWPDAIREIELSPGLGAGEPLLKLALESELPEQRVAALTALAAVADPPPQTAVALLPTVFSDGVELAAALRAVNHAVCTHGQHDLWSGRALATDLPADRFEQIYALPERLSAIMAAGGDPPNDAALAAKMLAIATRQIPPEPLRGVRVCAFGAEMPTSPAAAVLDGVSDSAAPINMWRYPIGTENSILFDLGTTRTVVGVRIWNLNESGGGQRGWKDIAVYVGSIPTELVTPVVKGIVPPAPGKNKSADYSVTVPVNFARGRYIRLRAENLWSRSSHTGLTEVEILGF